MTTIAIVAAGVVGVAAYQYLATPDVIKPKEPIVQTPANPTGWIPQPTSQGSTAISGPAAPTPVVPSVPAAIQPVASAPVAPAPVPTVPVAAAPKPSISSTPVRMVCAVGGANGVYYPVQGYSIQNPLTDPFQCANLKASLGVTAQMIPENQVQQCIIS